MYGRIHHFPFPDHHPPPFALIPLIMASMRNWLRGEGVTNDGNKDGERVVVVHCKAGKGRSGTVACSYLVSEEGWTAEDALKRFTERRMRVGFGEGVSIQSQVRWVGYVERWAKELGKRYVERPVEIVEIHIWGLRDGLKVDVEGFVEEGRKIKRFHRFRRSERIICDDGREGGSEGDQAAPVNQRSKTHPPAPRKEDEDEAELSTPALSDDTSSKSITTQTLTEPEPITKAVTAFPNANPPNSSMSAVILRPREKIILPTSDVNIDFERRAVSGATGLSIPTSIAHVWFNAYFEGGHSHDSGVFEAEWDQLDGIKGTSKRGTKAVDHLQVVWRYAAVPPGEDESAAAIPGGVPYQGKVVSEPAPGEEVPESHAADWRGEKEVVEGDEVSSSEAEIIPPVKDEAAKEELPGGVLEGSNHSTAAARLAAAEKDTTQKEGDRGSSGDRQEGDQNKPAGE